METEVPKWSTDKKTGRDAKPKAAQQGSAMKAGSTSKATGRAATKAAGKSKPTKDNAKKPPGIAGGAKKSAVYLTSSDEEDDFVGSSVTPKKKLKAEESAMEKRNNKQKQSQQSSSPDVSQSSRDNYWGVSHSSKDAKLKPDTSQSSQPSESQSAVQPPLTASESKEKIGPGLSPDSTNKDAHSETASMEAKKIVDGTGDEKASEDDEAGNAATPVRKAVNKESLVASSSKAAGTPSTRGANIGGLTKGRLKGSNAGFVRVLHPNATSDGSVGNAPVTPILTATYKPTAYKPAGLSRSSRKSSAGVLPHPN